MGDAMSSRASQLQSEDAVSEGRQVGCPYCGVAVSADKMADHVEEAHKRPELRSAMSFPDSHVVSLPPLMPRSSRRGTAVPKRVKDESSAPKPVRRPRVRKESAGTGAPKVPEREYLMQVPAPDSPPFLTKADFDRERTAKNGAVAPTPGGAKATE
jgi:hypothetical protein